MRPLLLAWATTSVIAFLAIGTPAQAAPKGDKDQKEQQTAPNADTKPIQTQAGAADQTGGQSKANQAQTMKGQASGQGQTDVKGEAQTGKAQNLGSSSEQRSAGPHQTGNQNSVMNAPGPNTGHDRINTDANVGGQTDKDSSRSGRSNTGADAKRQVQSHAEADAKGIHREDVILDINRLGRTKVDVGRINREGLVVYGGQWWYRMPDGYWVYYRDNTWYPYESRRAVETETTNDGRYTFYEGEWWYRMPDGYWMFNRDNQWNRYDRATFVPHARYSVGYRGQQQSKVSPHVDQSGSQLQSQRKGESNEKPKGESKDTPKNKN